MTRRLLLTLLILTCAAPWASAQQKRPNILFIYTDDQSHRSVGCYPESHPWVKTPNIDSIAKNGVRFTHAYLGAWCTPSRATVLTGRHPHGVESLRAEGKYPGGTYDPEKTPFWPRFLRASGYFTGQIGKWHTGNDASFGRDWDHQIVWNRPAFPDNAFSYYGDQMISVNGKKAEMVKGYPTDNYSKWAVDFIKGKTRDIKKPWFLWLCYGAPHGPHTPPERLLKEHPGVKVPIPADIYPPRAGKPDYVQTMETWVKGKDGQPHLKSGKKGDKDLHEWVRQYQQCVQAMDEGVGQVLAALKESGELENTLIIFTSDQGFAWGQHGFMHKLAPYDSNIRSPFIVSFPGTIPAGTVCKATISGTDIAPTLLSFAKVEVPWKMHGHDRTSWLKAPTKAEPRPILTEFTGDKFGSDTNTVPDKRYHDIPWWVSLIDGKYKYIRTLEENELEELYDREADPEELTNLALDARHTEVLTRLREATVAELRRTEAGMVDRLPKVKGG